MSSHDEAGGSARLEEDPIKAANHYFDYLDEHQMRVHGGSSGTNPDTDADTGTSTGTGTDTTPETSNDAVVAGKAPKQKRTRRPNELGIGQIVVTEMHPKKLEPTAGGSTLVLGQSTRMHPQGNRQHQRREVEEDTTYGAHAPKEVAQQGMTMP